ncbi:MAG TPA: adenosine-specific kinase, partial [Anaerolineaceae bacterium]
MSLQRFSDIIFKGSMEDEMELLTIAIEKPEDINFILGQTHFIKTVEDIHEALVGAV